MQDLLIRYGEILSIIAYFLPAVVSLVVLFVVKKKWIWLSIPIVASIDLIVWGEVLIYNFGELRGIALIFLVPQILITTIIALSILKFDKRKRKVNTVRERSNL